VAGRGVPLVADSAGDSPWTVAFAAGRATPIPLDSIEDDTPADSARLAADATRMAASLPGGSSAFRAIPFAVRTAWRLSPESGVEAVVAVLVRKVNQEANPREEQTIVIGERPTRPAGAPYAVVYHERTSGMEETIETTDVLAAVRLGAAGTPTLVLARDYGDGTAYSLVERVSPGTWRLRWSSAYAGC
jgi:hypothetical protein